MTNRRLVGAPSLSLAVALAAAARCGAQAVQRVDVRQRRSTQTGAPVPTSDPSDFVVREDNVAREVLRVAPADEPMQIALLVDNSAGRRAATSATIREALPAFIDAGSPTRRRRGKHQVAIITLGRAADHPHRLHARSRPAAQGRRPHLRAVRQRRVPARRHHRSQPGDSRSARPPRPVIVAIMTEGPELSNRLSRPGAGRAARLGRGAPRHHVGRRRRTDARRPDAIVLDTGHADDRRPPRQRAGQHAR